MSLSAFRYEERRQQSFKNWPSLKLFLNVDALAEAGLFYTEKKKKCQCFACGAVLQVSEELSNQRKTLDELHRRSSRTKCRFLRGLSCGNVPRRRRFSQLPMYSSSSNLTELPGPRFQEYANFEKRLETFGKIWPSAHPVKMHALASAGFFYLSIGDQVQCYYCGGVLAHHRRGENPWTLHGKYFPGCKFLATICGTHFVDEYEKKRTKLAVSNEKNYCIVCLKTEQKHVLLQPCNHHNMCKECNERVLTCVCGRKI